MLWASQDMRELVMRAFRVTLASRRSRKFNVDALPVVDWQNRGKVKPIF